MGNALDYGLFAASQLDDVAVGVAHEHRDVPALAKTDRSLGDRNVVRLKRNDGCRDGCNTQRDVSVAGQFVRDVHQNVGGRVARIGVEHEIEFYPVLVANNRDIVALRTTHQGEPEHRVKGQGAVEISYSDANVIDPLDCDRLGYCDSLTRERV